MAPEEIIRLVHEPKIQRSLFYYKFHKGCTLNSFLPIRLTMCIITISCDMELVEKVIRHKDTSVRWLSICETLKRPYREGIKSDKELTCKQILLNKVSKTTQ